MRFLARLKRAKKSLLIFTIFFVGMMALILAALYSVVAPSALNLRVPENVNDITIVDDSTMDKVSIDSLGKFYFNGIPVEKVDLENQLRQNASLTKGGKYKFIIFLQPKAKTETVVLVMDMAMRLNIDGILEVEK